MPVNYIQCHNFGSECFVLSHPDPKGMVVPMIVLGQERTFRVGGKIIGQNGRPFPPMANQTSSANGIHQPAEEIPLRHGSLLVFDGGHTIHSMLPANQDEQFNPNGFDRRISVIFRWTTPAMRKFGTRGAVEHGGLEQYEETKQAYRKQIGWGSDLAPATLPTEPEHVEQPEQPTADAEFVDASAAAPQPAPTKPTEPSPTVQLREWFATKYEAFKLSPSEQGRIELTLFNLTPAQVKAIGELLK
jgi:hypothetical protein